MGVLAEPEAEAAFDPTNYPKTSYPAAYSQKYKGGNDYCHPRKAPTCSKNGTLTFCVKDPEYPEKEVKVGNTFPKSLKSRSYEIQLIAVTFFLVRHRLRPVGVEEIRRCCRSVGR
jgi:hypothetical protein